MFTGIVTAIGTIVRREHRGDLRLGIACPWAPEDMAIGASIACSGVCLTVVERGGKDGDGWFAVDVSAETISCTAKDMWEEGAKLNLEPSLRIGDEIGGHIVTGHVDGIGTVYDWQPEGDVHFELNIIPHTAEVTTLGELRQGGEVNLEIDVVARYLQRMASLRNL